MSILNYFPSKYEPRPTQETALNWLEENVDKKYFFLNLPVGSGKSHIGIAFGNYLKSKYPKRKASYILTPQISLQKQYEEAFEKTIAPLYGKSNYNCLPNMTSCDVGSLFKPACKRCPNTAALANAINNDHAVMNYHLALIKFNCLDQFDDRSLIVFDECHQLENILTDYSAITITKMMCTKYGIPWCTKKTINDIHEWILDEYWPKMDSYCRELQGICDDITSTKSPSASDVTQLRHLNSVMDHMASVNIFMQQDLDDINKEYIVSTDPENIIIKCIFGANIFHESFQKMADKFLFMSATIFDFEETCKNLAIPLEEACFISLDSEFDKDNRPVIYRPTMKMNYGWENRNDDKKRMIHNVKSILKEHDGENGIIHTGNFSIAKWLTKELEHTTSHNIMHHNPGSGDNRNKIIEAYTKSKKPSILISPSITEGLDLCNDKARFVIFAKIPFGSLGDNWIKHRMNLSQNWYLMNALTDVMQGCGRVVRHKDDFGVVYILDESFGYLYNQTKNKIPKWWLEAFHQL